MNEEEKFYTPYHVAADLNNAIMQLEGMDRSGLGEEGSAGIDRIMEQCHRVLRLLEDPETSGEVKGEALRRGDEMVTALLENGLFVR